jgi:EF-P beta-lysylation protein EpmB
MITATARAAQAGGGDWRREWREAITDPAELLRLLGLDGAALGAHAPTARDFPMRVPRAYVRRMRAGDPHDPLLRQVLPLVDEQRRAPGFALDAVGDLAARDAPGVLHKYHGRALLVATGSCAVHCRYCFRRHFPYAEETAAREHWRDALAYLRAHPEIDELILSGGDPWSLATSKLTELTDALRAIPSLRRLRVHTRLPVVLPSRVDAELLSWLRGLPWPLAIVIHANHVNEIDGAVSAALAALRASGATLLNQSVLLRGVNDRAEVLAALSLRLFECGVLPYYLHQLDRVHGTAHFEVDDATATALRDDLQVRLPGYLVPRLVREVAGADSKTPL